MRFRNGCVGNQYKLRVQCGCYSEFAITLWLSISIRIPIRVSIGVSIGVSVWVSVCVSIGVTFHIAFGIAICCRAVNHGFVWVML
jgi:hypothetical protein